MSNKTKIMILAVIAAASYAGFFIYQRKNRNEANQSVLTLEEAYAILDKKNK